MDSGNSGSLQSSSGGDEEYDSRAAAVDSIFMSSSAHPPPHVGPIPNPPPPQPPPLFDPLSNYIQLHQNQNLLNPNMVWPRTTTPLRSDPNSTGSHDIINPFMPSFQQPTAVGTDNSNNSAVAMAGQNPNQAAARNPKKRSRASRRAPTTVLTTDTTNFRAMVQEFTGIPAPPFNSTSFPRTRLDLFGTRSAVLDAAQTAPPPYLRRPFAQKVQSPPFLGSSSLLTSTTLDAIGAASSTNNNNNISSVISSTSTAASTSINYQLPITQSSNLFSNIPNPLLASLIQTNPKFLFSNSSVMASKPQQGGSFEIPSSNDVKIGGLEEFDLGHGNHVTGLPNLVSSDQIAAQNDRNDNTNDNINAARWRTTNGVSPDEGDDYEAQMRPVNGGGTYNFPRNTKTTNYSASSSNFHGQKSAENNMATRGEGMVESWICSSD